MTDKYLKRPVTHLHTESPAAFNELANVPLTLAVAPRLLEELHNKQNNQKSVNELGNIHELPAKCVGGFSAWKQSYSRQCCCWRWLHLPLAAYRLSN